MLVHQRESYKPPEIWEIIQTEMQKCADQPKMQYSAADEPIA